MNKKYLLIIFLVLLISIISIFLIINNNDIKKPIVISNDLNNNFIDINNLENQDDFVSIEDRNEMYDENTIIRNFNDCEIAGNEVTGTNPKICKLDDGTVFINKD